MYAFDFFFKTILAKKHNFGKKSMARIIYSNLVYFATFNEPVRMNVCVYSKRQKIAVLIHGFFEEATNVVMLLQDR